MSKIRIANGEQIELPPVVVSDQFFTVVVISGVTSPDPLVAAAGIVAETAAPLIKAATKLVRRPA